jgi:hypothetical protein
MMSTFKRTIERRAARAAVHHSAHGVAAKVKRKPLRSVSLLSVGVVFGGAAGWLAGRRTAN